MRSSEIPFQPASGFKSAMQAGTPKFGVVVTNGEQIVEQSGRAGADFVLVDLEHGDGLDVAHTASLIRAADVVEMPVIVRVPRNGPDVIQRALDHGALGVCVPHVRSIAEAERAVSSARFAPVGERAVSPFVRAAKFTAADWNAYWQTANDEVVVMILVEDREGLENLEDIAAVPGIDVLWVGVGDLSQSLGVPLEFDHPSIVDALRKGVDCARRHGLVSCSPLQNQSAAVDSSARAAEVENLMREGYRMFVWQDNVMYDAALRELVAIARSAVGQVASA